MILEYGLQKKLHKKYPKLIRKPRKGQLVLFISWPYYWTVGRIKNTRKPNPGDFGKRWVNIEFNNGKANAIGPRQCYSVPRYIRKNYDTVQTKCSNL